MTYSIHKKSNGDCKLSGVTYEEAARFMELYDYNWFDYEITEDAMK